MNDYLAAIDAGTGGVRCVIFDAKGNAISQDYREMLTVYTPDGRAEQDPIQLMKGAWDAVRGAVIRGGIDASRIAGITAHRLAGRAGSFDVPVDARAAGGARHDGGRTLPAYPPANERAAGRRKASVAAQT